MNPGSRFARWAAWCALALPAMAAAAPFAYVPNEGSGTVSVIDTATDKVVAEIPAGAKPRGTAISPDGRTAYVSNQPNNRLVLIDLMQRRSAGAIALTRTASASSSPMVGTRRCRSSTPRAIA